MSRLHKMASFPLSKLKGYNVLLSRLQPPKVREKDQIKPGSWTINKGDMVFIRAGDDKGKTGKVVGVRRKLNSVLVEGMKLIHKHVPRTKDTPNGGTFRMESRIHVSNVALIDPHDGKPTGVRIVKSKDEITNKTITRRLSKASGLEIPKPRPDLSYQTKRKMEGPLDTTPEEAGKVTYEPNLETYPFPRTIRLVNHGTF